MAKNINGGTIEFKTKLDSANLKTQLNKVKQQIADAEKNPLQVKINTDHAFKQVNNLKIKINQTIKNIENEKVTIKTDVDTNKAKEQLQDLVKGANANLQLNMGEVAIDIGEKIGNALSSVFDKYFPKLYDDAKSYQQSLTNIKKLGYNDEQMKELDSYFKDISNEIGINREQVGIAGITAVQADVDLTSNKGKEIMENALMMSKNSEDPYGNRVPVEDIIKLLTRIEASYNGKYSVQDIADKFLKAMDKGIIELNDIVQYGGTTFTTAGSLGIDMDQMLALSSRGSITNEVPETFTKINAMLNEMRAGREKIDKSINQTYMSTDEKKELKNQGFENGRKIKGLLESGDLFATMNELDSLPGELADFFSNSRAITGSDIWEKQKQFILEYKEEISNSTGELERQLEIQNQNVFTNLEDAKNKINNSVKDALEEKLLPILSKVADVLDSIPTEVLGDFVVGMMGLGAVSKILTPIATLVFTLKNLSGVMGMITGASGLGGIVTLLSNPVFVGIAAAVVVLGYAFANWDNIMSGLKITLEWVCNLVESIVTFVWDLITGIGELIVKLVELSFKMSPLGLLSKGIGFIGDKISGASANSSNYSANSISNNSTYNVNNYVTVSNNADIDMFSRSMLSELRGI